MDADDRTTARLAELRVSARGWHGVQLAVLGFIGLCGVLEQGSGADNPSWLQLLSGVLVLAALAFACCATVLIGLAAWPIYGSGSVEGSDAQIVRTSGQVRVGILLTFVAVAILALATSSAWWPKGTDTLAVGEHSVEVTTRAGVICGDLGESPGRGLMAVSVGGRFVSLALTDVLAVQPVDGCR